MQEQVFKNILFPTDFSAASDYALSYAISMAKRFGAKLSLLHVVDTSYSVSGFYLPHISAEKLLGEMEDSAREMIKKAARKIPAGIDLRDAAVKSGIPYREIINFVKDKGIDMIIMGTSGKTGAEHLFFGSTTERVLRQAPCPVLTIRPPEDIMTEKRG